MDQGFDLAMAHRFQVAQLDISSAYDAVQLLEYQDQDGMRYATADDYRSQVANSFTQEVSLHNLKIQSSRFSWDIGMYYNRVMQKQSNYYDFSDYALRGTCRRHASVPRMKHSTSMLRMAIKFFKKRRVVDSIVHESDSR